MWPLWHSNRPPTSAAAKKKPRLCCVTQRKLAERQLAVLMIEPS